MEERVTSFLEVRESRTTPLCTSRESGGGGAGGGAGGGREAIILKRGTKGGELGLSLGVFVSISFQHSSVVVQFSHQHLILFLATSSCSR